MPLCGNPEGYPPKSTVLVTKICHFYLFSLRSSTGNKVYLGHRLWSSVFRNCKFFILGNVVHYNEFKDHIKVKKKEQCFFPRPQLPSQTFLFYKSIKICKTILAIRTKAVGGNAWLFMIRSNNCKAGLKKSPGVWEVQRLCYSLFP